MKIFCFFLANSVIPARSVIPAKAGSQIKLMKKFGFLLALFYSGLSYAGQNEILISQTDSTFDPFIDYGDFQDEVSEENTINFFQQGRSFSLALNGGYEAISFNIRNIYGDAGFFGGQISFFVNFHFAFQLSAVFPVSHYNSLYNVNFQLFHAGLDFKYYWNRQYVNEGKDLINPYLIFGPFWLNTNSSDALKKQPTIISTSPSPTSNTNSNTPNATIPVIQTLSREDRATLASDSGLGIKIGVGVELALIQQSFMGLEISYLYAMLQNENEDLSGLILPPLPQSRSKTFIENLQYPNRPSVKGFRFHGDIVNIGGFFGLNF